MNKIPRLLDDEGVASLEAEDAGLTRRLASLQGEKQHPPRAADPFSQRKGTATRARGVMEGMRPDAAERPDAHRDKAVVNSKLRALRNVMKTEKDHKRRERVKGQIGELEAELQMIQDPSSDSKAEKTAKRNRNRSFDFCMEEENPDEVQEVIEPPSNNEAGACHPTSRLESLLGSNAEKQHHTTRTADPFSQRKGTATRARGVIGGMRPDAAERPDAPKVRAVVNSKLRGLRSVVKTEKNHERRERVQKQIGELEAELQMMQDAPSDSKAEKTAKRDGNRDFDFVMEEENPDEVQEVIEPPSNSEAGACHPTRRLESLRGSNAEKQHHTTRTADPFSQREGGTATRARGVIGGMMPGAADRPDAPEVNKAVVNARLRGLRSLMKAENDEDRREKVKMLISELEAELRMMQDAPGDSKAEKTAKHYRNYGHFYFCH